MNYRYIPYTLLLAASAFVSASLGVYALLRHRKTKGSVSFILSMAVVTIWSGANAFEMSATGLSTKLFWANMQYIAYCFSPVTLLALCMQFTGYDRWIKTKRILWLALVPAIIVLMVWTDGFHGLVRYDLKMDYSGLFPVISKKYGPAFYVHALYSHSLNITSMVLLIKTVFFKSTIYRKQSAALLIGVSLIVLPNVMYIFGLSPVKRLDITPVFFGMSGLIIAWSIFRYRFFDVIPVARATVIETMDAGILVLDLQNRILDVNSAFENITGLYASHITARQIDEVCPGIPELYKACIESSMTRTEFTISNDGLQKTYEAMLSPLSDSKGALIGRLAVIYDITEKKKAEQEFFKQQWRQAVTEERERMGRDMHDNLGQVLGFINLQTQGIRQELINSGVDIVSDKLERLAEVARTAHEEVREYIREMRNPANMERDFIAALNKELSYLEEQAGINVRMHIPEGFSFDELKPNTRVNMLNIIKEALNNVRKHSDAGNAEISFVVLHKYLSVVIEDDGKGFDALLSHSNVKTRFGLDIMRERAAEAGGRIEIISAAGEGCRIELSVPLGEEKNNAIEIIAGG